MGGKSVEIGKDLSQESYIEISHFLESSY